MPNEKSRLSEADVDKVLAVHAHVFLPIVMKRRESALQRLLGAFKAGERDLSILVAEYSAHNDLVTDITYKLNMFNSK